MPSPAQRSRSFRKNRITTPGRRVRIHYKKKKAKPASCAGCGRPLPGVPTGSVKKISGLSKTQKRPDRPYGGSLCAACTKAEMKLKNIKRWEND